MMTPTVHLNGTSKDELVRQLLCAATALGEAQQALREAAPNARDYYPQGPDAFAQAQREHVKRCHTLLEVEQELMRLYDAIDEQRG